MVKIYTRKGDDGTTSLWYGGRVPKHHGRTEAYGALDEACSQLGVARALCGPEHAELATAPEAAERLEDGVSRTTEAMVAEMEERIDRYMSEVELPPQFVIPGGNQLSAQLDVARATIRRAERRIAALAERGELAGETVIHFVNRASDLAYAMARFADVDDPALFEGRRRSEPAGG